MPCLCREGGRRAAPGQHRGRPPRRLARQPGSGRGGVAASYASTVNASSAGAKPYRPLADSVLSCGLIYHQALYAATQGLLESALVRTRTARSQVDVSTTRCCSRPRGLWTAHPTSTRGTAQTKMTTRSAMPCSPCLLEMPPSSHPAAPRDFGIGGELRSR